MKSTLKKCVNYPLVEKMAYWIINNIMEFHGKIGKSRAIRLALSFHLMVSGTVFGFVMYSIGSILLIYYVNLIETAFQFGILLGTILGGAVIMLFSPLLTATSFSLTNSRTFFERNDPKSTVLEYRFVTKLLYVAIPLMIISSFIAFILSIPTMVDLTNKTIMLSRLIMIGVVTTSVMISVSGLMVFGIPFLRKDFRLYLAKHSLSLSMDTDNEIEKMRYVMFGLNSYDKYLKRTLKVQIKEIHTIFEKIISENSEKMNNIIKDLNTAFETDTFKPFRYLNTFCKSNDRDFLTKITRKEKFLDWTPFVAVIASFAISFIQSLPTITDLVQKGIEGLQNNPTQITNSTATLFLSYLKL